MELRGGSAGPRWTTRGGLADHWRLDVGTGAAEETIDGEDARLGQAVWGLSGSISVGHLKKYPLMV